MLSYRHAFHAGNHADVLKHAMLAKTLIRFGEKKKPFICIDTHAGAGIYDLRDARASTTGEHIEGIQRLLSAGDIPVFFQPYVSFCEESLRLSHSYPGSPTIARRFCRPEDSIVLMELHNAEIDVLRGNVGNDGRVHIHHRDGFDGLTALTPPDPRRGIALMDPSYEVAEDYDRAAAAILESNKKWPTGTFLLWYPILDRRLPERQRMIDRFLSAGIPGTLRIELIVGASDEQGFGLAGSGLLILRPPWRLAEEATEAMPWLANTLGEPGRAEASVEWLIPPN